MKKIFLLLVLITNMLICYSQKVDSIAIKEKYTSYYNLSIKTPLFFTYYTHKSENLTKILSKQELESYKCIKKVKNKRDSLLIILGCFGFDETNSKIPNYCYQIIKNFKTKKAIAYVYSNNSNSRYEKIKLKELLSNIPYSFELFKILCK